MSVQQDRYDRGYEEIVRDGIAAAKMGQHYMAVKLLNRAILIHPHDARPYLWLSATTDDPNEQRNFLEKAILIDPNNATVRRGLAVLNDKIDRARALSGGEQAFESELPASRGLSWAEGLQRLSCDQCGAVMILPAEEESLHCPYCASSLLVASPQAGEIIDPQLIAVMELDRQQAANQLRKWLGGGWFSPDDLLENSLHLNLHPGYYSCWIYEGAIEFRWSCEINDGGGKDARWMPHSGVETRFFDDILVPGVQSIQPRDLENVGPFDLKGVQPFAPEHVAGWPTLIYNRSLSEASVLARESVTQKIRSQLYQVIEPGREKRKLRTGIGSWSGMTHKHILLPLWVGTYRYRGKPYRMLINGQTGKVAGDRPKDRVKIVLGWAILALGVILLLWLLGWFVRNYIYP